MQTNKQPQPSQLEKLKAQAEKEKDPKIKAAIEKKAKLLENNQSVTK